MNLALRNGVAVAATLVLGYSACTLAFLLWPEIATNFANALFHGLEFRRLKAVPAGFDFASFAWVLLVLGVAGFWLGALAGWLFEKLGGARPASWKENATWIG